MKFLIPDGWVMAFLRWYFRDTVFVKNAHGTLDLYSVTSIYPHGGDYPPEARVIVNLEFPYERRVYVPRVPEIRPGGATQAMVTEAQR